MSNKDYKEGYAKGIQDAAKVLEKKCLHMDYCDYDRCNYAMDVRALLSRGKTK